MNSTITVGEKVQYWEDILEFSFHDDIHHTVDCLERWFRRLVDGNSPAAYFIPIDEPTFVIGVFRADYFHTVLVIVIVIQTKDWHLSKVDSDNNRLDLENDWKSLEVFQKNIIKCKILKGKGRMMFKSSPLQDYLIVLWKKMRNVFS
jgi:hypothetical protein